MIYCVGSISALVVPDPDQYCSVGYADQYLARRVGWTGAKQKALRHATMLMRRIADFEPNEDIKEACCEIAYSLIRGRDPMKDYELLNISDVAIGETRRSYSRKHNPPHIKAGIPSARAWALMRPYMSSGMNMRVI